MAKSKKTQGKSVVTGSKSDKGQKPTPRTQERGLGSEFANSVAQALEDSKHMKGSEADFLGVKKALLNPKDYADSLIDRKKR